MGNCFGTAVDQRENVLADARIVAVEVSDLEGVVGEGVGVGDNVLVRDTIYITDFGIDPIEMQPHGFREHFSRLCSSRVAASSTRRATVLGDTRAIRITVYGTLPAIADARAAVQPVAPHHWTVHAQRENSLVLYSSLVRQGQATARLQPHHYIKADLNFNVTHSATTSDNMWQSLTFDTTKKSKGNMVKYEVAVGMPFNDNPV